MTFEEALGQIELAVREHGATVEELVMRLRSGAISKEQFVAEARKLIAQDEANRVQSMEQYKKDGIAPFMRGRALPAAASSSPSSVDPGAV
jgi:hypothetical protein